MKFERINKASLDERSSTQDDGSIWELLLFAIFFIIVFSSIARADETAAAPETSLVTEASGSIETSIPAKTLFSYSGYVLVETSSQLNDAEETVYSGLYRLSLSAKHNPSNLSALARFDYERQYTHQNDDGTDGSFANPLFGISRTFSEEELGSPYVDTIALALRASIPGNRAAEQSHFQFAVGPLVTFTKAIGKFDLSQAFQYSRRQYEFDMSNSGVVNSPDLYRSSTEISFNVTEKLALSASVLYDYMVSFQGVGRSSELSSLSVDYTFTDKVLASLGVATQRGTLEADGETNRVLIYDPKVASGFFDLTLKF